MKHKLFENKKGVTNTTIAALVVVSLVVSIVGTWLVLESFQSKYISAPLITKTQQSGLVQLDVNGPIQPKYVGTTGLVTLKIGS